jgi:hypothetical protein
MAIMVRIRQFSAILLRRIVVAAVLMAAISAWPGHSTAVAGNADLWKVDTVEGTAWVQRNGAGWQPLAAGAELGPGSRVKTGKDGRIVISRPGDTVSVSPNSRFGIPEPATEGPVTHFMQNLGTLLFKIRTRPHNPFNIKTPYLAAIIRGTTFTVSVDDRNAALHVATGAVEVHSILSGETALVRPGETATIDSRTGGRMKLVGANGRKPVKKTNKTGAAGKTGKAASAVQKTGSTAAGGAIGATRVGFAQTDNSGTGGETSALKGAMKPAPARHVIRRAIGAGRINLFKLTKGLVNRAEARKNRARKKLQRKRAVGSKADTGSFTNLDDASVTSADGAEATVALLDEKSDPETLSTTTDSLATTDSLTTTDSLSTTDSLATTDSLTTTIDSTTTKTGSGNTKPPGVKVSRKAKK